LEFPIKAPKTFTDKEKKFYSFLKLIPAKLYALVCLQPQKKGKKKR